MVPAIGSVGKLSYSPLLRVTRHLSGGRFYAVDVFDGYAFEILPEMAWTPILLPDLVALRLTGRISEDVYKRALQWFK